MDKSNKFRPGRKCIFVAGPGSNPARQVLEAAGISLANGPECLAIARGKIGPRPVLVAAGSDARGLVYALLELADRIRLANEPLAALKAVKPVSEQPANPIRSVMRAFASEVEDKAWFYDRAFWQRYLSMLAARTASTGSTSLWGWATISRPASATSIFISPIPSWCRFPATTCGSAVARGGARPEPGDAALHQRRDRRRGLHFQLGLWTHAYKWTNSPQANHVIEGLTPESHAPYCRDALRAVLTACPAIQGVTFRIHGESGVAEGELRSLAGRCSTAPRNAGGASRSICTPRAWTSR